MEDDRRWARRSAGPRRMGALAAALAIGVSATMATPADAATLTYTGTSGSRSASALFSYTAGGQLLVTLTNTSSADALVPTDILTGLFFGYSGGALTPASATTQGSTYLGGSLVSNSGANVGGEWAYAAGFDGPGSSNAGISSSGLGIFGNGNFGGSNLSGPTAVDGLQYGITSAGDSVGTGNAGVLGNEITKNAVLFALNVPTGFSLASISSVYFQYGTALDEPRIPGDCAPTDPNCNPPDIVPEPGTLGLLGLGLLGVGFARRRRTG